jgi:O-antigen ligase
MLNKSVEKTISLFLFLGLPFATCFLLVSSVTDPVNVTKLFAAGCLAFGVFAIAVVYGAKEMWRTSKSLVIASGLFLLAALNAVFNSAAPLTQNIYGVFGRQTGFVAYVSLVILALSALLLRERSSFNRVIWGLLIAGAVNIVYAAWAIVFGDFIGWNNPYGNILGLFGNPNFIGAFLGMFITCAVAFALSDHFFWIYRAAFAVLGLIALYEIKESHAVQGLVVTGAGLAMIGFYWVRAKTKGSILTLGYIGGVAVIGAFALAGALQKGPLAETIYKKSVSLRGTYWETGINMGLDKPFTGVGMDTYGSWYRFFRPDRALVDMPGVKVITNAAHNVVIDIFAYGGFPFLISYLAILFIGIWAIAKVTFRSRSYDGTFVALATTWLAYQLQSIISINQIGLAIWGWVLIGVLVAYEYSTRPSAEETPSKGKTAKQKELIFSPQLVGGIGLVIGGLIAVPPLSADMKWKSALKSKDVRQVEAALVPSYLSPSDSARLVQAVIAFEQSKLSDLAYKYALDGVKFNPDYFDAWRVLYASLKSTDADKALALENMKRLDPKNPDVLAQ